MPRLGVWAGRVEGRVVSSPSEVVSGPQSRESEASEAAKAHRHSHSGMRMCPHPYKPTCTQIHTQTVHTRTHTLRSHASQRARLHGAGTQSNVWKRPPPPQGALQGTDRTGLGTQRRQHPAAPALPGPLPSQAAPPVLSGAGSSSPRPTAPSCSSSEHRCRHQAGHNDFTSPRQAD